MSTVTPQTTADRVLDLLREPPEAPDRSAGYLDLLGPPAKPSLAQSAMESTFLPRMYEKVWRPIGFNVAKGWPFGPGTAAEHAMARDWLGLTADRPATVLDVACGPGNVTRALADGVAPSGLVVGLDASETMLAQAVREPRGTIGYVRGDAVDLPFRDGVFDAVCCFGALYLFDDPWKAVDGMTRVLKPGGRLIILTSRRPSPLPGARIGGELLRRATGFTVFGDGEVVRALTARGFTCVRRHRYPLMQVVGGRRS
ncbi:class I SAM-dependent methyltransferase [Actinomadura chokoriensis]|uniref:class I SAM-dependent methyltransferase n=1 Tax=Actinomadura chokoriensis TaxID=454156 RepID=UPI0031F98866